MAFANKGYTVNSEKPSYLGRGIAHAFGEKLDNPIAAMFSDKIDEAMLCGMDDIPPIQGGVGSEHRNNFANHLRSIHEKKEILKRESGKIGCMHYPWLTSQNLYI